MRRLVALMSAAYVLAGAAAAALSSDPPASPELLDPRSAGDATTQVRSRTAFTQHPEGLSAEELGEFAYGNRIFSTPWVEAPASVAHFDGLGPFFSSRSCSGCHVRDGRGRPPDGPDDVTRSMVTKLGAAGGDGRREPDPRYGGHLNERAVRGLAPEGRLAVRWEDVAHEYPDGTRTRLRRPRFEVVGAKYGPLAPGTRFSVRMAPAVIGTGLLEAVPDSLLASLADPEDANGDGISGRVHWLAADDAPDTAAGPSGRFGWKATQSSVAGQVTTALADDIGITTPARPVLEITAAQRAAHGRPNGGEPELAGAALEALVAYCRLVAVPARRDLEDPAVRRGAERFREAGCVSCHVPTLRTGEARATALSRQVIHPFSDLLLHDMGAELSDGMPEGNARPEEWRTPPLWGLGLAALVSGHFYLLHDGRARSLEEAILWHGGEGQRSRDGFRSLPAASRRDLIRFLESL